MVNAFTAALAELAACQSAEFGTTCQATIGTQTVACVMMEEPFNSIIVEGGESQSGQQIIAVDKSLLTSFVGKPKGWPPINDTPTAVLGVKAFVLNVIERLGVLYITTGQPESEDS